MLLVALTAFAAFLVWFYAAAKRAGLEQPLHAVSCWFVPAVNLLLPCAIALQLATAARADRRIVGAWWAVSLLTLVAFRYAPALLLVQGALTCTLIVAIERGLPARRFGARIPALR